MRYPDAVTILRASGADEYGNPYRDWTTPTETAAKAFVVQSSRATFDGPVSTAKAFLPPDTDVHDGDRLRMVDGTEFDVVLPMPVRSPSKTILVAATLTRRD